MDNQVKDNGYDEGYAYLTGNEDKLCDYYISSRYLIQSKSRGDRRSKKLLNKIDWIINDRNKQSMIGLSNHSVVKDFLEREQKIWISSIWYNIVQMSSAMDRVYRIINLEDERLEIKEENDLFDLECISAYYLINIFNVEDNIGKLLIDCLDVNYINECEKNKASYSNNFNKKNIKEGGNNEQNRKKIYKITKKLRKRYTACVKDFRDDLAHNIPPKLYFEVPKNVKVDIYNLDEIRRKYFTALLYRLSDSGLPHRISICWPHLYDMCEYCQIALDFIKEHKNK